MVFFLISGCDSTSTFFSKGKSTTFAWLQNEEKAQGLAVRFQQENLTQDEVALMGSELILSLYKCTREISLNEFRYVFFKWKVAKSIKPTNLERRIQRITIQFWYIIKFQCGRSASCYL